MRFVVALPCGLWAATVPRWLCVTLRCFGVMFHSASLNGVLRAFRVCMFMCRVPCSKFVVCHMQWQARMTIYYGADGDALPLCGDERVAKVML